MTTDDTILIQNLRQDILRLTDVLEKFREASQDACDRRMEAAATWHRAEREEADVRLNSLERWRWIITGCVVGVAGVAGMGGIAKGLTIVAELAKAIL